MKTLRLIDQRERERERDHQRDSKEREREREVSKETAKRERERDFKKMKYPHLRLLFDRLYIEIFFVIIIIIKIFNWKEETEIVK